MGTRQDCVTVAGIYQAFAEHPRWTQADLARRLQVGVPALSKALRTMSGLGFPAERSHEHPHIYWTVPDDWHPAHARAEANQREAWPDDPSVGDVPRAAALALLLEQIRTDRRASQRVIRWLDRRAIQHSGHVSGPTLAALCGVDGRTWTRWIGGEQDMPVAAWRLIREVSGV